MPQMQLARVIRKSMELQQAVSAAEARHHRRGDDSVGAALEKTRHQQVRTLLRERESDQNFTVPEIGA